MTDFGNQKTTTPTDGFISDNSTMPSAPQELTINGVTVQALFEAKVRKQRKRATPYTIRRPSYLRYIEYS